MRRSSSTGETSRTNQAGFTAARSYTDPGRSGVLESCDPMGVESVDGAGLYTPTSVDEKLKADLLEKQSSNSKYQKMMVSLIRILAYLIGTVKTLLRSYNYSTAKETFIAPLPHAGVP